MTIVHRNPELEERIAADPDAEAPRLVYGDWLQACADPRGELIALQAARMRASDPAEADASRAREDALVASHRIDLLGPAASSDFEVTWRLGFVHHVDATHASVEAVDELLGADHPATRFLRSISVGEDADTAPIRELCEAVGRSDVRVFAGPRPFEPCDVDAVEASVHADPATHDVSVVLDLRVPGYPDHAYLSRVALKTAERVERWCYGGGSAVTEEPLPDDPPFTGALRASHFDSADIEVEVRVSVDGSAPLWLRGQATIRFDDTHPRMRLTRCAPLAGEPFTLTPFDSPSPERGPVLIEPEPDEDTNYVHPRSAALPFVGVYVGDTNELVLERERSNATLMTPRGDVYLARTYGGPKGALVVVYGGRPLGTVLALTRLPAAAKHVELRGIFATGAMDDSGSRFALVFFEDGSCLAVYDVDRGVELARAVLKDDSFGAADAEELRVFWHGDAVWAITRSIAWRLDVATGALTSPNIPSAIGMGWRHYGASSPAYHPIPGRTAWMICAAFPDEARPNDAGTTLIAWRDGDGSHGTVAVPDHGWANEGSRFGEIAVLEDGRIVAIGNRVWLVDRGRVSDLGPSGSYSKPLVVRAGRLWSHGGGPWWIAVPERV